MATTFTKAILLDASFERVEFDQAALDDGSAITYIIGYKSPVYASAAGVNLFNKNTDNNTNAGYAVTHGADGSGYAATVVVGRATAKSTYRDASLSVPADSNVWLAMQLDRTTGVPKLFTGPYGGTVAERTLTDIGGGSGAAVSDASYALKIGANDSGQATIRPTSVFFFGRWDSALSGATISSYCSDMDTNGKPSAVLYIKPTAADTADVQDTSGNNYDGTYVSAPTIVDGPDAAGGSAIAAISSGFHVRNINR